MFYTPLKIFARLALRLYCRSIYTSAITSLQLPGPLLIASNHPNSFLDAVIIASHCRRRTYILVRGDVFRNKWANYFLRRLYCIPIYRRSEGRRLMDQNTLSFGECLQIFKEGKNVLIFSEGICENEWTLRPLGKGTARLAFMAWANEDIGEALRVVPVGLSYQNFNQAGKKVFFLAGTPLSKKVFAGNNGKELSRFNLELRGQLHDLILHVPGDPESIRQFQFFFEKIDIKGTNVTGAFKNLQERIHHIPAEDADIAQPQNITTKRNLSWLQIIVFPVALAGWLIHAPLYYPLRSLTEKKTAGTVYYDSVLFGLLFFIYPLYLIIIAILLVLITKTYWSCLILVVAPVLAFITVRSKLFSRMHEEAPNDERRSTNLPTGKGRFDIEN